MTTLILLASLLGLSSVSAVALVRAVRHAPEGRQTKVGFVLGGEPAPRQCSEPETIAVPLRMRPGAGTSPSRVVQTASVR
jgi:hypothetical protein